MLTVTEGRANVPFRWIATTLLDWHRFWTDDGLRLTGVYTCNPLVTSVMGMLRQLTADLRLEVELRFIPTIDGVAYSGGTLHGETIIPVSGSP
jgi:hypothetical protein